VLSPIARGQQGSEQDPDNCAEHAVDRLSHLLAARVRADERDEHRDHRPVEAALGKDRADSARNSNGNRDPHPAWAEESSRRRARLLPSGAAAFEPARNDPGRFPNLNVTGDSNRTAAGAPPAVGPARQRQPPVDDRARETSDAPHLQLTDRVLRVPAQAQERGDGGIGSAVIANLRQADADRAMQVRRELDVAQRVSQPADVLHRQLDLEQPSVGLVGDLSVVAEESIDDQGRLVETDEATSKPPACALGNPPGGTLERPGRRDDHTTRTCEKARIVRRRPRLSGAKITTFRTKLTAAENHRIAAIQPSWPSLIAPWLRKPIR
jgi:hypothetical protein